MGSGGNIIAELTTDHREVEEMFGRIQGLPLGSKERKTLIDQVTIELVRHSVAEEMYLYPAVREDLPGGGPLADKEIQDHAKVEQMLKELDGCGSTDPRSDTLVQNLVIEVSSHVQDEEQRLFPALAQACSAQRLQELGEKVRQAKKVAPTRPHPSAPDTPPGNKLLAPGAGLVDRVRDLVSGRGK